MAYKLIDSVTLGASAASVTFSSITQDYRDLVLVINATSSLAARRTMFARFNSDTGTNYKSVRMVGFGSLIESATLNSSLFHIGVVGASAGNASSVTSIMDYSATDKHKTLLNRKGDITDTVTAQAMRWANTSAINTILLWASSGDIAAGSTFYLYGIEA